MDIDRIEQIAHAEMAARRDHPHREPGWILYHGKRTGKIAMHLAELVGSAADRDVLYVAGLFHDVGKGGERHNEAGAALTRKLLAGHVPESELAQICEAVRGHNQRQGSDDWPEVVRLIQDADVVDHAGPIDVWLSCYWSGSHGETIHDQLAYFAGEECRQYRDGMRMHLNFEAARQMFEARLKWADQFFADFHRTYFEGL